MYVDVEDFRVRSEKDILDFLWECRKNVMQKTTKNVVKRQKTILNMKEEKLERQIKMINDMGLKEGTSFTLSPPDTHYTITRADGVITVTNKQTGDCMVRDVEPKKSEESKFYKEMIDKWAEEYNPKPLMSDLIPTYLDNNHLSSRYFLGLDICTNTPVYPLSLEGVSKFCGTDSKLKIKKKTKLIDKKIF